MGKKGTKFDLRRGGLLTKLVNQRKSLFFKNNSRGRRRSRRFFLQ